MPPGKTVDGGRAMARQMRAFVALAEEVVGSLSSPNVVAHKHLQLQFQRISHLLWPLRATGMYMAHTTCMEAKHPDT